MLRDLSRLSGGMGVCGTHLVGTPASEFPVGFEVDGLLNNDVLQSDPVDCLYRVEILPEDRPSSGILTIAENGAFSLEGAADGVYQGPSTNYKNDVPEAGTYRFEVGAQAESGLVLALSEATSQSTLSDVTLLQTHILSVASLTMAATLPNVVIPGGLITLPPSRAVRFDGENRSVNFSGEDRNVRF